MELAVCLAVSFVVTYLSVHFYIPRAIKAGITGKDMNKRDKPEVAEMGGLAVVAGFLVAYLLVIYDAPAETLPDHLASLATILVVTIVGMVDDLFDMRQSVKAVLPVLASLPLAAIKAGTHIMHFPVFGAIYLGDAYPLLLVPLGITGAANAFNMLGGINGLETGMGIISCVTVLVCAVIAERTASALLMACMVGALCAFYIFNRYPSKVFPGDVGTLTIGAAIAAAVIIGNMERVGLFVVTLYFAELVLKARTGFKAQCFGTPTRDGLEPPEDIGSLTHIVMRHTTDEPRVAYTLFVIQILLCSLVIMNVYLAYWV